MLNRDIAADVRINRATNADVTYLQEKLYGPDTDITRYIKLRFHRFYPSESNNCNGHGM